MKLKAAGWALHACSVLGLVLGCAGSHASTVALHPNANGPGVPGHCATPASERLEEMGCYLTASDSLGTLHGAVYWHLDAYPTRARAIAARGPGGTVVESLGRVWLFTIAGPDWRPAESGRGERVGRVGPLPIVDGQAYTARYMESILPPGLPSNVHRHAGPEAWYLLKGDQCLETPSGVLRMHAGEGGVVPGGPSMQLLGVGTTTRRALVLVLHASEQPWITPTSEWIPTGACRSS